mgnify:FL=1
MGLIAKIRSLFKGKYDRIKREEVVDAIVKLQSEEAQVEERVRDARAQIEALMAQGREEKDMQMRLFLAKKINYLKEEQKQNMQRATYLLYNVQLLNRLKSAIDDKQFFSNSMGAPLNSLLADQRALAQFLNKALNTRVAAENVLTEADETFNDVLSAYEENEKIYGVNKSDDELLAVFETGDALAAEGAAAPEKQSAPAAEEKDGTVQG